MCKCCNHIIDETEKIYGDWLQTPDDVDIKEETPISKALIVNFFPYKIFPDYCQGQNNLQNNLETSL